MLKLTKVERVYITGATILPKDINTDQTDIQKFKNHSPRIHTWCAKKFVFKFFVFLQSGLVMFIIADIVIVIMYIAIIYGHCDLIEIHILCWI